MRVLLVDDHAVVREGLRQLLLGELPDAVVEGVASAEAALDRTTAESWTLLMLDLSLPNRSGLDVLPELRALRPRLPILVMTMHAEPAYADRAFRGGASGYLTKGSDAPEILRAVRRTLAGERHVSPAVTEALAATLGQDVPRAAHESPFAPGTPGPRAARHRSHGRSDRT